MWMLLTDYSKEDLHIFDSDRITEVFVEDAGSATVIALEGNAFARVMETPETIYKILNEGGQPCGSC